MIVVVHAGIVDGAGKCAKMEKSAEGGNVRSTFYAWVEIAFSYGGTQYVARISLRLTLLDLLRLKKAKRPSKSFFASASLPYRRDLS
jgi:hypothetical protein